MSLIIKPPSWGHCSSSLTGTPTILYGTSITSGAANTDGTTVALLTNVSHDVEFLVIHVTGFVNAATNTSGLLDIMIDPAGGTTWSTDPLIPDLLCGHSGVNAASGNGSGIGGRMYFFPVWIKAGTSIGARHRSAAAANVGQVIIYAYGGNANPSSWWCGTHVTAIGVTPASSIGTAHTPGNTGVYSAWANFGSTLPAPCGALQFAIGAPVSTTITTLSYIFEFGVASTRLGPNIWMATTANEAIGAAPTGPLFCSLPIGTQLQARATCSATAAQQHVAAYAVH